MTLAYRADESSILVSLSSDGRDGSAAAVADQLRVLILEELVAYKHLNHRLLVQVRRMPMQRHPMPPHATPCHLMPSRRLVARR